MGRLGRMKAVAYRRPLRITEPDSLLDVELPMPEPRPHDLIVEVRAISVNPADVKMRASVDPNGTDKILGWDAAGIVRSVGTAATLFRAGDEVFYAGAIDRPGAYSQFHAVDERIVGRKPASLDFAKAAALPLTSLTAWELLFDRLGVPYGKSADRQSLLIIGAAGGVGSIATQIARRLTSLIVIATASRQDTRDWVETMGAHHIVDHTQPLVPQLRPIAPNGVRYVMGLTHTEKHFDEIIEILAPEGHLGLTDDPTSPLDITKLKQKACALHWELMFTRSLFQTPTMPRQGVILNEIADLVDAGLLRTTFKADFGPINAVNLKRAHALIESARSIGKVVLSGF